jgi:hypothetical protein
MTVLKKDFAVSPLIYLSVFLITIAFRFTNLTNNECDYYHFDEQLVSNISENMYENKIYDNNWIKHFEDPESIFHVNQYNFSSYIYFSAFIYSSWRNLTGELDKDSWDYQKNVHFHRIVSSTTNLIAILLTVPICLVCFKKKEIAIICLFLCSFSPLLVQDSHYARPEGFLTLNTVLVLLLTVKAERPDSPLLYLSFFLGGILISCKISMAVIILVPIIRYIHIFKSYNNRISEFSFKKHCIFITLAIIFLLIGIIVGMPYALINFQSYISGIKLLSEQYSRTYPPYSLYNGNRLLFYVPYYFFQTYGYLFWIIYIYGNYRIISSKRYDMLFILNICFILLIILFSFNRAFFERNFTPFIPYINIVTAAGLFHIVRDLSKILKQKVLKKIVPIMFGILFFFVPLSLSYRLVFIEMDCERAMEKCIFEKNLLKRYSDLPLLEDDLLELAVFHRLDNKMKRNPQIILKLYDFNDEFTENNMAILKRKYLTKKIGEYSSIFSDIRACTLHTYHSPTIKYFILSRHTNRE